MNLKNGIEIGNTSVMCARLENKWILFNSRGVCVCGGGV